MNCSHCNRKLETAHHILGLTLGSECVHKYAFFEGWMNSAGFQIPQEFPMIETTPGFYQPVSDNLKAFKARAGLYGIQLEITFDFERHVAIVTGVKSVDLKQVRSYSDTRDAFAQSVGAVKQPHGALIQVSQ